MVLAQAAEVAGEGGLGALLTQLGVGGILVFLFMKQMFEYLKSRDEKRKNGSHTSATNDMFALLRDVQSEVRDLHKWHDVRDEDQVPVWYVRKSLERQIEKFAGAVEKMSTAAERQVEGIGEAMESLLEEMRGVLQEVRSLRAQEGRDDG
jgi:hypothetical protein